MKKASNTSLKKNALYISQMMDLPMGIWKSKSDGPKDLPNLGPTVTVGSPNQKNSVIVSDILVPFNSNRHCMLELVIVKQLVMSYIP